MSLLPAIEDHVKNTCLLKSPLLKERAFLCTDNYFPAQAPPPSQT